MNAEIRVIKSVFCKDFETFFSRKRTRSVRVKTSLPPFNPSAGCRVSACDPVPSTRSLERTRTWTRTWTRSLDKFYHVFSSCKATCPSSARELGQGTTAGCLVTQPRTHGNTAARGCPSSLSKFPGRTWTSGSARGKHVIEFVQVPCPSSGLGGGSEKMARPHTR